MYFGLTTQIICIERKKFNAKDVFDRASAGDQIAEAVVNEVRVKLPSLRLALRNNCTTHNPDSFVLFNM